MFKIVIDSTTDLPTEVLSKHNLLQIPLQVIVDGKNFRDKVEIAESVFYQKLETGSEVSTSLPLYEDIFNVFEKYAKDNIPFIYIAFSTGLSGTYNQARLVMDDVRELYPTAKMTIIDSKSGGLGEGVILLKVLEAVESGSSYDEVISLVNDLVNRVEHVFMVNSLDQLIKGGRITGIKAKIGSLLRVRPVLTLPNGSIQQYKSAIGTKRALREVVARVNNLIGKDDLIGINYADNIELADEVEKMLNDAGYTNIVRAPIGSVFAAHIGSNAVGVYFFK